MAKASLLPAIRRLIFHPLVYYTVTFVVAVWLALQLVAMIHAKYPLDNGRIFSFSASIFLPILTLLWGGRFVRDWIRQNRKIAHALGEEKDEANESYRELAQSHFGAAFIENVFAYETFWTRGYQTDLNRHTVATAIAMVSAVISISMGLLIFSRGPAGDAAVSPFVTALGGALPALVTATSLKIWLETRKNLDRTRQQVDLLLRQRIRLILFCAGKEQFASSEAFEDHVHASSMFLDYLRSGSEAERPEPKPKRRFGRRAAEPPIPTVEILPTAES